MHKYIACRFQEMPEAREICEQNVFEDYTDKKIHEHEFKI